MVGKARKRGVGARRAARARQVEEEEEEEQGPPPSPGDPSYFQDQVDAFHEERARAALAASWSDGESGAEDPGEEEEVLGLDVEEESEEEEEEDEEGDEAEDAGSVGGSSLLSDAEDADPSLAWGRRKSLYYSSDSAASKGRAARSQQEAEQEELDEEEEAQRIQRRLAQALHEDDSGLSWVRAFGRSAERPAPAEARTRVATDLGRLPVREKLKLLRREAPELPELLRDLKAKLAELRDELEPLLRLAERGLLPPGRGCRYLRAKYSLYLHYCSNVSFYLVLKARRAPVRGHPVIQRLVTYRTLINRLAAVDRRLAPDVRRLLARARGGAQRPLPAPAPAPPGPAEDSDSDQDQDQEAAREHYREMEERLRSKRKKEEEEEEEEAAAAAAEPEPSEPSAKRAITYQIAKNKGLTPRRKKMDRNPRVKHREKFRRAKIRRRGQVPQPRTEERKYGGELSGIRAGLKKSIRLR
ncbi:something about silencing protein 10 [Macrotis lagotis]|uniref:something about silencing protein 10 n=1 Tax=Macrotis lagotis TaxID=92651 RepID=UPI003D6833E8